MDDPLEPLPVDALYRRCDPAIFPFATTAEVAEPAGVLGQTRALRALEFGVDMRGDGYNLFVLGRPGSHQLEIVREFLARRAERRAGARDWIYLNNFDDERRPIAASLAPASAVQFRRDMAQFVDDLRGAIPAAFESEHFRNKVAEIDRDFEERQREWLQSVESDANERGLSIAPTPQGFVMAPVRGGQILNDQQFEALPADERQRIRDSMAHLSERLRRHVEDMPQWHKERRERIRALQREVTDSVVARPIETMKGTYGGEAPLARHLDAVREDVLANSQLFQASEEREASPFGASLQMQLRRYEVNVLVDHSAAETAPIVHESNPSVQNMLGRAEYVAQFGALVTDFTLIRPGALHRANGGFLIVDAQRLLLEPYAWQALKRALYAREIRMESLGQLLSLVSTASLEPDAIPLDVKVILIGERQTYYLLAAFDPDFGDLFKVSADFEDRIDRSDDNTRSYGAQIASIVRREQLRPFDRAAVARVVEHGARVLGDAGKLTTRLRDVTDLLREADYFCGEAGAPIVGVAHVERAIVERTRRLDRLRDEMQDEVMRHSVLIDTSGAVVGQVNGLSVIQLGEFAFGRPTRITATARIGRGEIVDIERETELGGPIHTKGVLILSSYLAARYCPRQPLSLRASVVFEQSYGGVEGDSASVAETCALLSALSNVPIQQRFAVTGSVNQHGDVQVIGGANEKIEGFFDLCKARGLDGHGVLIPRDNVQHLMLRADVVEAVRRGEFRVYGIGTIDEAIALLTGVAAGTRGADGAYPAGTVNGAVEAALTDFATARREYDAHGAAAKVAGGTAVRALSGAGDG